MSSVGERIEARRGLATVTSEVPKGLSEAVAALPAHIFLHRRDGAWVFRLSHDHYVIAGPECEAPGDDPVGDEVTRLVATLPGEWLATFESVDSTLLIHIRRSDYP